MRQAPAYGHRRRHGTPADPDGDAARPEPRGPRCALPPARLSVRAACAGLPERGSRCGSAAPSAARPNDNYNDNYHSHNTHHSHNSQIPLGRVTHPPASSFRARLQARRSRRLPPIPAAPNCSALHASPLLFAAPRRIRRGVSCAAIPRRAPPRLTPRPRRPVARTTGLGVAAGAQTASLCPSRYGRRLALRSGITGGERAGQQSGQSRAWCPACRPARSTPASQFCLVAAGRNAPRLPRMTLTRRRCSPTRSHAPASPAGGHPAFTQPPRIRVARASPLRYIRLPPLLPQA